MATPTIQAQYDTLAEIATQFDQQATDTETMVRHLIEMMAQLEGGGWDGDAAKAFFREMNDEVTPATNRLHDSFVEAGSTTRQIIQIIQTAEEEAANQFQITGQEGGGQSGGGGGGNSSGGGNGNNESNNGGSNDESATIPSRMLVQTHTDQIFEEDYMDNFIGSRYQGEDSADLNRLMENLMATNPSDTGSVNQLLNQIADVRGVERGQFREQYDVYRQLLANQGGLEAIDLSRHGDFLGSTASMRYGAVVGDVFDVDPVFGALLNPTGGMVGPGNDAYNPGDNDAIGYHGIFHDAAGFLLNNHNVGPGYDYLDREPFDTTEPMTGQIGGVSWWAGNHPELDVDFSNAHEAFDVPYVPEFVEAGVTGALSDLQIINDIRLPMHIYEGGSDIIDGIGDLMDRDFSEGGRNILDGVGTVGGGVIRYGVETLIENPIANGISNGVKTIFGF